MPTFLLKTKTGTGAPGTGQIVARELQYNDADERLHVRKASGNTILAFPALDTTTGKIKQSDLPSVAIGERFTAANQAARLALTAQIGDVCLQSDNTFLYLLTDLPASTNANWVQITGNTGVTSVNTLTGSVTLSTTNIGEGTNLYHTSARVNALILAALADTSATYTFDGGTY